MSKSVGDPSGQNSKIFISYRRADIAHAGRLSADLKLRFGDDQVFMDVEGIRGGDDFVRIIEAKLASAKVLIAVIGRQWLAVMAERNQAQDETPDWVHLEIATALERRVKVIPVLVGGAAMPSGEGLPDELSALPRQHAISIRDDRWHLDTALLIRILEEEGLVPRRNQVSLTLVGAVALALVGVCVLSWYFFSMQMVAGPAADGKFSVPAALMGTHQLTIEGPRLENSELLFSHVAAPTEEMRVDIQRAQLSPETVDEFKLDPRSSQTFNELTYATAGSDQDSVSPRKCNTLMEVSLKDKTQPAAIQFYQVIDPEEGARDLKMKIVGAELFISLSTTPESEDDPFGEGLDNGLGCWKHLLVGSLVNDKRFGINTVAGTVAADSEIQIRFTPHMKTPLWEGREGPFALGSLKARAVRIGPVKGEVGSDSLYEIHSVDENNLLRIDSLAVEPKQLRIGVSGESAFVTINNRDGVGYLERIQRHWLVALFLALITIALSLWLAVLVRALLGNGRLNIGLR